ncbi:unnamed protein product [Linum trigynum]|uniref:Uncharacterized protein n=1 Tax=Linum trigynum TaxID=586398 RepID=A0AAV2EGG7_9ROSI
MTHRHDEIEDYYSSIQKYFLEEPPQVDDYNHDEQVYDSHRLKCLIQSLEAEINYGHDHDHDLQQQLLQEQQPLDHVVEGSEVGSYYGDHEFIISWNNHIEIGFNDSFFLERYNADNMRIKRD